MPSCGFSGGQYRPLSGNQVKMIHETSLSILEKIGFTGEKGIEVNDRTLAADLIIEQGPGNHFLEPEHTMKHRRNEFFIPEISMRNKRTAGHNRSDALLRAKTIVQEIRQKKDEILIQSNLREKILKTFPEIKNEPA